MDKLKPCPFCGCEAEWNQVAPERKGPRGEAYYFVVGCLLRDGPKKLEGCGFSFSAWTKDKAFKKWNTRTEEGE